MKERKIFVNAVVIVVFVLAFLILLPNINEKAAKAMSDLPVVGKFFDVITFRDYKYKDDRHEANVKVPKVITKDGNSKAADEVNKSVREYTDEVIKQFKQDVKDYKEGYEVLDVDYTVILNDDKWFVLEVLADQIQASGFETAKYYNIYKKTDQLVSLKDLFKEGYDYVTPISEFIKEEMRARMKKEGQIYFLDNPDTEEWNFKEIKKNQNFYINDKGQLVIAFGEAEVGPAYIGRPEFVITERSILQNMIF